MNEQFLIRLGIWFYIPDLPVQHARRLALNEIAQAVQRRSVLAKIVGEILLLMLCMVHTNLPSIRKKEISRVYQISSLVHGDEIEVHR